MNSAPRSLLRGIAAYGLRGSSLSLPYHSLDDATCSGVLADAARQRVTGHLVHALEDGAFAATAAQQAAAMRVHEAALGLDLRLERLLVAAVSDLDRAGIPSRVLKGPAVAHMVYPDPSLRSFGDIDLLVPTAAYDDAVRVLGEGGARRRFPELRAGFDRRFGKGACLETPDGLELDLHRTLAAGPFGLAIDADVLFTTSCHFALGGRTFAGLDPEARFVHACFHAALGDAEPRLVALRDVAQILLHSDVDAGRVRDLCHRWRCGIVVERATRLAWDGFAVSAPHELVSWAWQRDSSSFECRSLRAYVGRRRSYARQAVAGLSAVPGIRDKATYAGALFAANASHVRRRDGGYARRFGRALRLLVEDRAHRRRRGP
ncbi:MAG: nucleotidyltransferase family protein [Acidimicrobiia bacterium]